MNSGVNKNTAKFVPNGIDPFDTKPMEMKNEFDEWLARIICFAFSISPQALSQQMNRATAQTAQESSLEEGLYPVMEWVRNLINSLINNYFGYKDIEFMWDIEEETNPEVKAKIDTMYIQSGVKTVNEVRAELGLEPLSDEELAARQPAPVVADEGAPFQSKMAKKKRWY